MTSSISPALVSLGRRKPLFECGNKYARSINDEPRRCADHRRKRPAVRRSAHRTGLLADLRRTFDLRRLEPLQTRQDRYQELAARGTLDFLPETQKIRDADWQVTSPAPGLVDRRIEITGPTDRKMTINALNCGAKVWLADMEDASTPAWASSTCATPSTAPSTSPRPRASPMRSARTSPRSSCGRAAGTCPRNTSSWTERRCRVPWSPSVSTSSTAPSDRSTRLKGPVL